MHQFFENNAILQDEVMQYLFPNDFIFGTSTAAAQIETAFDHDWQGVKANDGNVFDRTTDHELRFKEDAEIFASLHPIIVWDRCGANCNENLLETFIRKQLSNTNRF
ncbi:MAG: family 1 glycosylhydrolase [Bacteroidota bacterium]